MQLVTRMKDKSDEERLAVVGAMFRQALIDMGFSPDMHIDDFPNAIFSREKPASSKQFLQKIYGVYEKLDEEEKKIFKVESLERGRHYQFWYLTSYDDRRYKKRKRRAFNKINSLLLKEAI